MSTPGGPTTRDTPPPHWVIDELVVTASEALGDGVSDLLALFEGRWVGVLASPENETSRHLAVGMSVLPAKYATPPHSHEAEEVAIILEGTGRIEVGDDSFDVAPGSVVLAPPDAPHRTIAHEALTILWVYAPAGSEQRWIPGATESKVE